jgi:hypothetical protein
MVWVPLLLVDVMDAFRRQALAFLFFASCAKNSRQLMKILWHITASSVQFVSILMPAVLFVIK